MTGCPYGVAEAAAEDAKARAEEAKKWIDSWKSKQ